MLGDGQGLGARGDANALPGGGLAPTGPVHWFPGGLDRAGVTLGLDPGLAKKSGPSFFRGGRAGPRRAACGKPADSTPYEH